MIYPFDGIFFVGMFYTAINTANYVGMQWYGMGRLGI